MMEEGEMFYDKDDSNLVKVNIVDENNPAETTLAAIPQDYYDRIISGQSTLKKETDNDGNVTFVLVDVILPESKSSLNTLNQVINNTTNLHSMSHENDQMDEHNSHFTENIRIGDSSLEGKIGGEEEEIKGEEYTIIEYPSEDGYFVVVITDSSGENIFEKAGQIGDTLMWDLCGTPVSYLISGPNDDGSVRQTTVCIDQSENDYTEAPHEDQYQNQLQNQQIPDGENIDDSHGLSEVVDENQEEYVISEETVLINNLTKEMVRLSDKNHNVLDTKYGIKGDTVKLQLTDKAFEYLVQGPRDDGESRVTAFIINNTDEEMCEEPVQQNVIEDPAVHWCPNDISHEDYAAIRDSARQIATELENTNDLPPVQPYSEELGSRAAYQDLVNLVGRYKSHVEERQEDLQLLRRHSKIYMSTKPTARKMTKLELLKNEAAAQICRYIPSLLFHKRRLHKYVQGVIDRSGLSFAGDEQISDHNRPFTGPAPILEEEHNIVVPPLTPTTRHHPQSSLMSNANNYMAPENSQHNNFNQAFNFGKRDLELTTNEENAIRIAAERLQEELYQYPILSSSVDSKMVEDLEGLQVALSNGDIDQVERAHEYMRKESALSGRLTSLPRRTMLSPYDVAVNEASYHLVRNNIGLLTHEKTLLDLARKVIRASGFNFRQNGFGGDKKEYNHNGNMWLNNQEAVHELDLSTAVQMLSDSLEEGPSHNQSLMSFVPAIVESVVEEPDSTDCDDDNDNDDDDDQDVYRPQEFHDRAVLANINMECEPGRNILNETVINSHTGTDNLKKVRILDLQHCSFTSILPIDINQCYNLVELNLANNAISYLPRCLFLPNLSKLNIRNNRFVTVPLLEQFPKLNSVELDEKVARKLNKESLSFFCSELRLINGRKFESQLSDEFSDTFEEAKSYIETMVQSRWEEDLAMFFKGGVTKSECQKVIETLVIGVRTRKVHNEHKFANFKDLIARRVSEAFLESKITDDYDEDDYKERLSDEDESEDDEEANEERMHPRFMHQKKSEFDLQTVEKGQILLNDEPLDRLTNVVGQALRCGKTVVYSVMRTAARQPGGDLIPVGGGDSMMSSNYPVSSSLMTANKKSTNDDNGSSVVNGDLEPVMKTRPGPASFKKRKYGIETVVSDTENEADIQQLIDAVMEKVELFHNNTKKKASRQKNGKPDVVPTKIRRIVKESLLNDQLMADDDIFKIPNTLYQDEDIGLIEYDMDEQAGRNRLTSEDIIQKVDKIIENCREPITPLQLRKMLGVSCRGRPSQYIMQASNQSYVKHNQEIPEAQLRIPKPTRIIEWTQDPAYDVEESLLPLTRPNKPSLTTNANESKTIIESKVTDTSNATRINESVLSKLNEFNQPRNHEVLAQAKVSQESKTVLASGKSGDRIEKEEQRKPPKPPMKPQGVLVTMPTSSLFRPVPTPNVTSTTVKIPDYDPLHFIRCHALDNNPQDCSTKVWRCAFEPSLTNPCLETTSTVATCGGECVCLIDCASGKVKKRFKYREEEFYSVAWTTVEIAPQHQINILAAAGKLRDIRLLHSEQMVCYAEMKGHEFEIACMTFHPRYPTILYSGDALANILVWDIGVPSAVDYTTKYQLLSRLTCPRSHLNPVLNLVVMPSHDVLVAGCEDGIFVWQFNEFRKTSLPDSSDEKRLPDFEVQVATHQEPCFDGLSRLSENTVLVKSVEEGEIFTMNFVQILAHYRAKKFDDSGRVVADVIGWLRWQITDEIYINVSAQHNRHSVLCGDNEGTIWIYDMNKEMADEHNNKKFKAKPAKCLEWPECNVDQNSNNKSTAIAVKNPIVNCVEMSSDGKYLVAVTDNNLVCIWSVC